MVIDPVGLAFVVFLIVMTWGGIEFMDRHIRGTWPFRRTL